MLLVFLKLEYMISEMIDVIFFTWYLSTVIIVLIPYIVSYYVVLFSTFN